MEWERTRSLTVGLIRTWLGNIAGQPEFRGTVLASVIWLLWVDQFQPWKYSSAAYKPPSLIDVIGFFFWRIGFNPTHNGAVAASAGILSIASLIYLAGWVLRSFGNPSSRSGGSPRTGDTKGGSDGLRDAASVTTQRRDGSVENSTDFSFSEGCSGGPETSSSVRCQPAIHRHWNNLPGAVQHRLLLRQSADSNADQFRFSIGGRAGAWITLACFSAWLYLLPKVDWNDFDSAFAFSVVITACCVFFTLRTFGRKVPGLRPHLRSYFYATRLYFIRTDFDEVWFWPATELQGLRYDGRAILSFEFADWTYR